MFAGGSSVSPTWGTPARGGEIPTNNSKIKSNDHIISNEESVAELARQHIRPKMETQPVTRRDANPSHKQFSRSTGTIASLRIHKGWFEIAAAR